MLYIYYLTQSLWKSSVIVVQSLVLSDSLRLHGLQNARLPCPSPSPGANYVHCTSDAIQPSCPLSSPSLPPFNLSQHQGFFPVSWLFASGGQSIRASALASVIPVNIQGWFPLGLSCLISLQSKEKSSLAPQFISITSSALSLLYGSTLTSICHYWKNHSFHYMELCWQSDLSAFQYTM